MMVPSVPTDVEAVPSYQLHDQFLPGAFVPCHVGPSLDKPPEWLDQEKYSRGQAFCRKYLTSVILSYIGMDVFAFVWRPAFQVFIYYGMISTVKKEWQRQTCVFRYASSWFEGDIWDVNSAANRTMRSVQQLHKRSGSRCKSRAEEVLAFQVDTSKEPEEWAKSQLWSQMRKDACLPQNRPEVPPLLPPKKSCFISQLDIAFSVFAFVNPILSFPRDMGIHGASREDLEGLLHLWRVFGYYLGLEDRFNPCAGTLEDFHTLSKEVYHGIVLPGLGRMTREEEHCARVCVKCLTQIPFLFFINLDIALLLGARNFGFRIKHTYRAISFRNKFLYGICLFFLSVVMRCSLVVKVINYITRRYMEKATN